MVRGPRSGNGTRSSAHYLDSADLVSPRPQPRAQWLTLDSEMDPLAAGMQADGSLAVGPGIGGSSRGAGGRWVLWPLRVVLWTALLVIAFRGITAIIFSSSPAPAGRTGTGTGGEFPVSLAEAYATEFGRGDPGFSRRAWASGTGSGGFRAAQRLGRQPEPGLERHRPARPAVLAGGGHQGAGPQHAVVTLLALLGGQLMELGVPVAATGRGLVVSGEPAWLPAPPQASPPPAPRGSDQVAQSQLMNELPAFFQAYASGDSAALNRFGVHGVSVAGLGGAVTFDQISALHVPPGGTTRQITVTVIWQLSEPPGSVAAGNQGVTSKLEMTYGMSVVDLQGGKWYVKGIGASSEAVGAR